MSDLIDKANAAAETARLAAISEVTDRHREPQLVIEGEIVCIDCLDPIDADRLEKTPAAALCVPCLDEREQKEKRYGY